MNKGLGRRKGSDNDSLNRNNHISNIIQGVERKINDVLFNKKKEREKAYAVDNFEVNYPYGGGIGGIP